MESVMRTFVAASLMILVSTLAQAASLPAPKVQKINDRVYALLGPMELPNKSNQGYMVNTTVIIGEKGVILVDTGSPMKSANIWPRRLPS